MTRSHYEDLLEMGHSVFIFGPPASHVPVSRKSQLNAAVLGVLLD